MRPPRGPGRHQQRGCGASASLNHQSRSATSAGFARGYSHERLWGLLGERGSRARAGGHAARTMPYHVRRRATSTPIWRTGHAEIRPPVPADRTASGREPGQLASGAIPSAYDPGLIGLLGPSADAITLARRSRRERVFLLERINWARKVCSKGQIQSPSVTSPPNRPRGPALKPFRWRRTLPTSPRARSSPTGVLTGWINGFGLGHPPAAGLGPNLPWARRAASASSGHWAHQFLFYLEGGGHPPALMPLTPTSICVVMST